MDSKLRPPPVGRPSVEQRAYALQTVEADMVGAQSGGSLPGVGGTHICR